MTDQPTAPAMDEPRDAAAEGDGSSPNPTTEVGAPEASESTDASESPNAPEAREAPDAPDDADAMPTTELPELTAAVTLELGLDGPAADGLASHDHAEHRDEAAAVEAIARMTEAFDGHPAADDRAEDGSDDGASAPGAADAADAGDDEPDDEAAAESADDGIAAATGPRTAGRMVAEALRAAGVRFAFTVPGESFLGLLDALPGAGIRVVATRHEGAAAFMAEAYAQLTGRPAACLATRAVGAANLAIGLQTAREDSAPVFALVGQVERSARGREAFQEADLVRSIGGLVKWAAEPTSVDELATALGEAIRQALGDRPGPVLLSLAEDLLDELVPDALTVDQRRPAAPRPEPDELREILQLLAAAERPAILAGAGVLRARTSNDLVRLAEALRVPVIASWRRGDLMSNEHPLYLGMTGYFSPAVVRERLERADVLLVLGSRLNEPTSFGWRIPAEGVPWAHVDLAPRPADGFAGAPTISIRSDARAFLRDAYARLKGGVLYAPTVDARSAANEVDRAAWEAATAAPEGDWDGPGVNPGRIIEILRRVLPDEAILTTDAGNFGGWLARGFRFRRPGTFLGPTSGAMGYGLPAAIAAGLVHRDRPVVAVCGDGGLAMTMAELETATREGLNTVVVVFDNQRFGTIRMHQDRRPGDPVATDLGPIDFAAIARACGGRGVRIEKDSGFEPALRQALASDRPTVIQLALDRAWVSVDETPLG